MNRRGFLMRAGGAALGLGGAKMVLGALQSDRLPDGGQSRGMITGDAQRAIDGGLAYLESQQHPDGSFGTVHHRGNVAITSLCGLAFMAGGHQPSRGRFGHVVTRALEFLINLEQGRINNRPGFLFNPQAMRTGPMYGHGFATLFLAEAYGMVPRPDLAERLRGTLGRAVQLIIDTQNNEGGWRYEPQKGEADISVTICQVMALRAAKNAGFAVPASVATKCTRYVERLQDPRDGGFRYMANNAGPTGFARTAAGVVALYSAGVYRSAAIDRGLDYLIQRCKPGTGLAALHGQRQEMLMHYYYGHYYAVQAMWIAGGRYWAEWYPAIRDELVNHPDRSPRPQGDGSWWDRRTFPHCPHYGTAMASIILQVPNNYLPIFQR
jgi:hypothetical protein